jgi:hypothetical protein
MNVDFIIIIIDWVLLYIFDLLFSLIDGFQFGSVIMHFRCKLGMSKTMFNHIANIKELYASQRVKISKIKIQYE